MERRLLAEQKNWSEFIYIMGIDQSTTECLLCDGYTQTPLLMMGKFHILHKHKP